ncbi:DNA translocase FtsK [Antarcticirhabdus aurantiaca]|uniref:DNA translocase FtsK n=1 Tax=Antarcticirhabdus aurantiaca TaxID=2606717 RepID=UPI00131E158B|nr:DNA translocase FtsK [Antarcticirhabdus aurantiaca]
MASTALKDEARDKGLLRRQGEVAGGVALAGLAAWLGVALATWTVSDPSFSHANSNEVQNWAGQAGASAADLLMQLFGMGAVLLVALPVIWAAFLFFGRPAEGIWRRAWFALGGTVLFSAVAGCIDLPAGWPLPIGLGGIAGDVVLKLPAALLGDFPSGLFAYVLAAVIAVPATWLFLNGAGIIDRDRPQARLRGAAEAGDEAESRLALVAGACVHHFYSVRAAVSRRIAEEREQLRQGEFGNRFDSWEPEEEVSADTRFAPPKPPRAAQHRDIRVAEPYAAPASAYVDPLDGFEAEDEADFPPAYAAPAVQPHHAAPAASAFRAPLARAPMSVPAQTAAVSAAFVAPAARREPSFAEPAAAPGAAFTADDWSRGAALAAQADWSDEAEADAQIQARAAEAPFAQDPYDDGAAEAERAFEGHEAYEAYEDQEAGRAAPVAYDDYEEAREEEAEADFVLEASDRVVAAGGGVQAEPAAVGGWRGLLQNNIVAFPGRKEKGAAPEPAMRAAQGPAAPRMPAAPAAQAGHATAVRPAAPPMAPAAASTVSAEQQRLRTGSGRAPAQRSLVSAYNAPFELPSVEFLTQPKPRGRDSTLSPEVLQENARLLEGVLEDFGVKGEIIEVRPGPVVTLYELEPAPGIKSSRVIGLADDIARSMSAIAARVAVIPGKNAIGIELPNQRRETVYLREMMAAESFAQNKGKLALTLGKTIGGEPVIADLAKMPHLLVAGTTGSGKSVAINTMILSLLYRMTPAQCRLIMIDPKMLELSIYDGIPHLLTPVVTDPKKAVVALKWAVREMEDRYRKMSKVGVRNIDGFNERVASAIERGETISRTVQTGFDRETGEPVFETEEFDLQPLPYIVVLIDEMADLMMVAGKDIEGTVQRLAQMARAAGIHVIMATQRPSVDVITGTIKANFPTRISFQVTSKIDSRTILGEQGAEQLLGQGDMLFMAGGGRIQRVHGPFVGDNEVEAIVNHLKAQGVPDYLDAILVDEDEEADAPAAGGKNGGGASGDVDEGADLYDQAVAVVLRDGKASTSYVQRRLGIGYNRAASIIERMEKEGIVGPANHAGKREILVPTEEAI